MTEPNRRQQPEQQRTDVAQRELPGEKALSRRREGITRLATIVKSEAPNFDRLLPDHLDVATFMSAAGAALWKSQDLMAGATNDPGAFLEALRESAMLGHIPGTDHYWLTPRKRGQGLSVLGIEGYQGIVERMYRSGGVLSVHAEIVREHDTFEPYAGPNGRPLHQFGGKRGAFSKREERGEVIGSYAYAILPGGVPSQIMLLSIEDLWEIRAASDSSSSKYSPWNKWPLRMYLKSALRRLEPYVPVSAGYRQTAAQAQAFVAGAAPILPLRMEDAPAEPGDVDSGDDTVQEGEIVEKPVTDVRYDARDWGGDPGWDDLSVTRPGEGVPDEVRGNG